MPTIQDRLREADAYLNKLWTDAQERRDKHTGDAHADINAIRHGIGAFPDVILETALRIDALEAALITIGHSLVCAPTDYAEHNARELCRAGEIARAVLATESSLPAREGAALEAAARALAKHARVSEMEARGFNGHHAEEYTEEWWREHLDRARHCVSAYLAAALAKGEGN